VCRGEGMRIHKGGWINWHASGSQAHKHKIRRNRKGGLWVYLAHEHKIKVNRTNKEGAMGFLNTQTKN
jgi:hypothetical protein